MSRRHQQKRAYNRKCTNIIAPNPNFSIIWFNHSHNHETIRIDANASRKKRINLDKRHDSGNASPLKLVQSQTYGIISLLEEEDCAFADLLAPVGFNLTPGRRPKPATNVSIAIMPVDHLYQALIVFLLYR